MVKWIIGGLVGLVVMLVVFFSIDPNVNQVDNNTSGGITQTQSNVGNTISIKIEGQVLHPGTYSMSADDTIFDLVEKAGGLLAAADEDAIKMGTSLGNREVIYIPKIAGYTEACVADDTVKKVNVNTASVEELTSVNGISSTVAKSIVTYRNENGEFDTIEDLLNVSGIGEKTYEKIRDYVTLK